METIEQQTNAELIQEGREILAQLTEQIGGEFEQVKADLGFLTDNSSFANYINLASKFIVIENGQAQFMQEQFEKLFAILYTRHGEFLRSLEEPPQVQTNGLEDEPGEQ